MRIIVIRHAEKPDARRGIQGVNEHGRRDAASLSPRGWQRAGALACAFTIADTGVNGLRPVHIYAAKAKSGSSMSRRSIETVQPLAGRLGLLVDTRFGAGNEQALIADALTSRGPVLISWKHESIPKLGAALVGKRDDVPRKWPGARFDVIWCFTRCGRKWEFEQIPQVLLDGDSVRGIAVRRSSAKA